jgi:Transposase IS66 family
MRLCERPSVRAPRRLRPKRSRRSKKDIGPPSEQASPCTGACRPSIPRPTRKSCKKQRPAHNLLIRFKTFKEAALRFLADFPVPFPNNLAEQDLRMMKAKTKISGGFRNPARRRRLRSPALRDLIGPKARPQHIQSPGPHPRTTRRRPQALKPLGPSSLPSTQKLFDPPEHPKTLARAGPPWQLRRCRKRRPSN